MDLIPNHADAILGILTSYCEVLAHYPRQAPDPEPDLACSQLSYTTKGEDGATREATRRACAVTQDGTGSKERPADTESINQVFCVQRGCDGGIKEELSPDRLNY